MRQIISFNRVSADGFFCSRDGGLDWVVPDDELDATAREGMPESDTILFGRRTYDMFESFWPHALEQGKVASDPHRPGRTSPALREMAVFINEATKLVWSHTRKQVTWKNSRLLHEFDPRELEALKQQPGKNMMVFGSGSLTSLLIAHGLLDQLHLIVNPVLLGDGLSLVSTVTRRTRLELLESKAYPTGNVRLRYACRPE